MGKRGWTESSPASSANVTSLSARRIATFNRCHTGATRQLCSIPHWPSPRPGAESPGRQPVPDGQHPRQPRLRLPPPRRYQQATTNYLQALALFRTLDARQQCADTLTHLGDTHYTAGSPAAARDAWQQALALLTDLRQPGAAHLRTKLQSLTVST